MGRAGRSGGRSTSARSTRSSRRCAGRRSSRTPGCSERTPSPGSAGQDEIQTGGSVGIAENGASGWSVDPVGDLPGSPGPLVVVRVRVPDPKAIDANRLDALVAAAKPAHVMHRIELVKAAAEKG